MTATAALPTAIRDDGLIAVLRTTSYEQSVDIGLQLFSLGLSAVELTLTTPEVMSALVLLRESAPPGCVVGMGTVISVDDAERSVANGASFLVTPMVSRDIAEVAGRSSTPVIMGALSPTEIVAAQAAGAAAVKIFPASTVGAGYLAQLRGPFPNLMALPSGGVAIDDIGDWIAAGAAAVCLGGSLTAGATDGNRPEALARRVAAARAAVSLARA